MNGQIDSFKTLENTMEIGEQACSSSLKVWLAQTRSLWVSVCALAKMS